MRERLTGAWTLVSYVLEPSDGSPPTHPMGTEPKGFLLYTTDGHMSAQIMNPGRPPFASGRPTLVTSEEVRAAFAGYLAYSGRFHTDDAAGTVTHEASVSLYPTWVNVDQVRAVSLDGDTLVLSTVEPIEIRGRTMAGRLTWKRALVA